jgi:rubrerythrin
MIIFGTKFWAWGSALTRDIWRCAQCGHSGQFTLKSGMNFITLYWIIPVIPISGVKKMVQCPNCKARYEADSYVPPPESPGPYSDPRDGNFNTFA